MVEVVRSDRPEIAKERLEGGAPMIARGDRVMPSGLQGVEKRERGLDVEVGHAEVRHGSARARRGEAEKEFQRVPVGEDRVPARASP